MYPNTILTYYIQYSNLFTMKYERTHVQALIDCLNHAAEHLIYVTGPRQSGKTTIVRQALRRLDRPYIYMPVDNPRAATILEPTGGRAQPLSPDAFPAQTAALDAQGLVRAWDAARVLAARSPRGAVLALDEIQKIDNWTETVKGLWDADRWEGSRLRAVLLGSAPLLMQQGLTESMTGRFQTLKISHWSFGEMAEAFDFDLPMYMYFGGYPGAAELIDVSEYRNQKDLFAQPAAVPAREDAWREYVLNAVAGASVGRDIVALRSVENPALLAQLFHLGCAYSGQILSYKNMLGRLEEQGNAARLAHYLELLSQAGLISGLKCYSNSVRAQVNSSPKLNVRNTALMSSRHPYTFASAQADRTLWGHLVESAVGAHLCNASSSRVSCFYWRRNSNEVDFVLRGAFRTVAVEVKSGETSGTRRGFNAFREQHPEAEFLLVGRRGVPLKEFLSASPDYWVEGHVSS